MSDRSYPCGPTTVSTSSPELAAVIEGAGLGPDHAVVRGFLQELHLLAAHAFRDFEGDPGVLQIIRIHPASVDLVVAGRFKIGSGLDEMTRVAINCAEAGHNVYVEGRTVRLDAPRRGSAEHTVGVFSLVADRDLYSNKFGRDFAVPTLQVETSPGSFHDWFALDHAIRDDRAREIGKAIRAAIGADSNTGNPSQPYRVAGTPNYPNAKKIAAGRATCGTSFVNSGPVYAPEFMLAAAGEAPAQASEIPDVPDEAPTGFIDEHVEELVSAVPEPGADRSAVFTHATKCAVEAGMTAEDFEGLCRANPQGCSQKYLPPESGDRLHKKIAEIWGPHKTWSDDRDALGAQAAEALLSAILKDDSLDGYIFDGDVDVEPPPALVKDLLPKEGIAFVGGQSGAGKSFIAIHLAICLATVAPFFGHRVKERVGTLILAAEGSSTLPIRLQAAKEARKISSQPIVVREFLANLSNDREVDRLCKELRTLNEVMRNRFGVRIGLIVIDTVAASFTLGKGDPNAEAAATIRRMRVIGNSIGALVMPVHHYGKDETTGLLGASGWRAGTDAVLSVLADRNQITGKTKNRQLALAKSRVGPEGPIAPFELEFVALGLDEDSEVYGSMNVVPRLTEQADVKNNAPKLPKAAQIAFRALQEAIDDCGESPPASNHIPASIRVTSVEMWRKYAYQRGISTSEDPRARQVAFKRASDHLVSSRTVTVWGETVWISSPAEYGHGEQANKQHPL